MADDINYVVCASVTCSDPLRTAGPSSCASSHCNDPNIVLDRWAIACISGKWWLLWVLIGDRSHTDTANSAGHCTTPSPMPPTLLFATGTAAPGVATTLEWCPALGCQWMGSHPECTSSSGTNLGSPAAGCRSSWKQTVQLKTKMAWPQAQSLNTWSIHVKTIGM